MYHKIHSIPPSAQILMVRTELPFCKALSFPVDRDSGASAFFSCQTSLITRLTKFSSKSWFGTYSLPVQKLDTLLANHITTPRSLSGCPICPMGFKLDHFSRRCSWVATCHLEDCWFTGIVWHPGMVLNLSLFWCLLTGQGKTSCFVCDASQHGSDEDDTTSIAKLAHLLSSRLCCIQDTIHVNIC